MKTTVVLLFLLSIFIDVMGQQNGRISKTFHRKGAGIDGFEALIFKKDGSYKFITGSVSYSSSVIDFGNYILTRDSVFLTSNLRSSKHSLNGKAYYLV